MAYHFLISSFQSSPIFSVLANEHLFAFSGRFGQYIGTRALSPFNNDCRASVNGIRVLLQYGHDHNDDKSRKLVADFKAALILETGYRDAFQNWSARAELAPKF